MGHFCSSKSCPFSFPDLAQGMQPTWNVRLAHRGDRNGGRALMGSEQGLPCSGCLRWSTPCFLFEMIGLPIRGRRGGCRREGKAGEGLVVEGGGDGVILTLGACVEPCLGASGRTGKATVGSPASIDGSPRCAPRNRAASPPSDTLSRNALISPHETHTRVFFTPATA